MPIAIKSTIQNTPCANRITNIAALHVSQILLICSNAELFFATSLSETLASAPVIADSID